MDPTTIVIPPAALIFLAWVIRGIATWYANRTPKSYK
jgi:hypothetical protein